MDIGISHHHSGRVDEGEYTPAEIYCDYGEEYEGIHLVLNQMSHEGGPSIWHLNQDIILSLGLIREENTWVCPQDGYIQVARLNLADDDTPTLMEMKAEYLKDYLCAREMGIHMTSFYCREVISENAKDINWEEDEYKKENGAIRWEGRVIAIHEGGDPFGEKMAIFHVERTDVDENDDIPDISGIPTDENTKGESWERKFEGKKLYRILGELWKNQWIEPGKKSPKVRGDRIPSSVYFIIDSEGTKINGDDLIHSGKWLWFRPEVIMALCHRRGGPLTFYSQDTGSVSCSYGDNIHFGVNDLCYINVYAKDIGIQPEWQQQIWAGYNITVTPEGGVSKELLASQVKASPANT